MCFKFRDIMIKEELIEKCKKKEPLNDLECEWLAYLISLESRNDSDHPAGSDPHVGAVIRNSEGIVIGYSHRANAFEGDHAEYSLLKGQLNGHDLSYCELFTTLEPCVDDVRKEIGSSCSSLICSSAINTIHIGILDPNIKVYGKGIEKLFLGGKIIIPFSSEVTKLIKDDFEKMKSVDNNKIIRVKTEVFSKFELNSLRQYLADVCLFENRVFDFEVEKDRFANKLLDKGLVAFNARNVDVDEAIKIVFYDRKYLKTSSRQFRIQKNNIKEKDKNIVNALPLTFKEFEKVYSSTKFGNLSLEEFKEAIANAIIHRDYGVDAPLTYIHIQPDSLVIINKPAANIPVDQLKLLSNYETKSYPGSGVIAELFNAAGYCERSRKGMETFKSMIKGPKIKYENGLVEVSFKFL